MIERNDACWCKSGKKWKKCHSPLEGPIQVLDREALRQEYFEKHQIIIKTDEQIEGIRAACKLASYILEETCKMAKAGVTTQELDDFAHKMHLEAGAIPGPLNYKSSSQSDAPFPKSICTSLNEVVCHGIPDNTPLKEGDILNVDVTSILNGYYGDCGRMVCIGNVSAEKKLVTDVSYECLMRAVNILKPGIPISAIGDVITAYAHAKNCSVVYQFVGHGVGVGFHERPRIPHCKNRMDILLAPGMIFTIEPMINAGLSEVVVDSNDHWTTRTIDGRPSAQWEHQVLITDKGHEVLTQWKR
jgi:methionyl aminopeptidase